MLIRILTRGRQPSLYYCLLTVEKSDRSINICLSVDRERLALSASVLMPFRVSLVLIYVLSKAHTYNVQK